MKPHEVLMLRLNCFFLNLYSKEKPFEQLIFYLFSFFHIFAAKFHIFRQYRESVVYEASSATLPRF